MKSCEGVSRIDLRPAERALFQPLGEQAKGSTSLDRRFYEISAADDALIATEALARIAEHYAIVAEICGRSPDKRRTTLIVRKRRSLPL